MFLVSWIFPCRLELSPTGRLVLRPPSLQLHSLPLLCLVRLPDRQGRIHYPSPQLLSCQQGVPISRTSIFLLLPAERLSLSVKLRPPMTWKPVCHTRRKLQIFASSPVTDTKLFVMLRRVQIHRTSCFRIDSLSSCLRRGMLLGGCLSCSEILERGGRVFLCFRHLS